MLDLDKEFYELWNDDYINENMSYGGYIDIDEYLRNLIKEELSYCYDFIEAAKMLLDIRDTISDDVKLFMYSNDIEDFYFEEYEEEVYNEEIEDYETIIEYNVSSIPEDLLGELYVCWEGYNESCYSGTYKVVA